MKHEWKRQWKVEGGFSPLPEEDFGHLIQQAILPILTIIDEKLVPLGTGFVIQSGGLMMTARHVLEDVYRNRQRRLRSDGSPYDHTELYAIWVTSERHGPQNNYVGGLWPIDYAYFTETGGDIGLCWLRPAERDGERIVFPSLKLHPHPPQIGERVIGFGYHSMSGSVDHESETELHLSFSQKSAFTAGKVTKVHEQARDSAMLKFPCFETDARFDAGMSGGPICNQRGSVCGVICSSWAPADSGQRYISHASIIWPSLGCHLEIAESTTGPMEKRVLFDLLKNGTVACDCSVDDFQVLGDPTGERTVVRKLS